MKHKLLSLFALAGAMFMSTSVWAQTELADPVKPKVPVRAAFTGDWVAPEAGKNYYIYNVGASQFLGAGLNWGTRAVASADSVIYIGGPQHKDNGDNKVYTRAYILPFAFSEAPAIEGIDETLYYFQAQNTSKGKDIWLCHEENAAWIDGGTARRDKDHNGWWRMASQDDSYILRPVDYEDVPTGEIDPETENPITESVLTAKAFGLDANNMGTGNNYTWTDLTIGETSYVNWKFIEATQAAAESIVAWVKESVIPQEAIDAYNAQVAIYDARVALKATIANAEEAGIEDVDAAIATYNNPNATLDELKKQNSHLNAEIAGLKYKDIEEFSIASEDNPQDITEYVLVNPTFDANINGWTITVTGQNLQWQGRTDGVVDEAKNWVTITNFIEAWRPSSQGGLGDGTISQTVYGLPKGKYVLECDAMATRQGGLDGKSAEDAVTGAYIFIEGEDSEVRNPIKAPDTQPKHWSVTFICKGGDWLTFGLKAESTTANWLSADNFKLTFYGETNMNQGQLDLQAAIEKAEELMTNENFDYSYAGYREAFDTAKELADGLITDFSQEESVYAEAAVALNEAVENVSASILVYQTLEEFISDTGTLAEYEQMTVDNGWDDLSEELSDWHVALETAYAEGAYTDEEVTKAVNSLRDKITAWIAKEIEGGSDVIKKGTDLTILLVNPDFSEGSYLSESGKEFDGNENSIPGWTISSGNIKELRHSTGNIETWHKKFDFNQTIANMPAGIYDITVQGFVRHDDSNATDQTIFYAGDTEAQLMLCSDQNSVEGIWRSGSDKPALGDTNYDVENTELGGWECHGMTGFYYWSITENTDGANQNYKGWKPGDMYYTNHIKVILLESGDFKIGLKSLGTTDWVIWDNFKIYYLGADAEDIVDLAQKKLEELIETYEDTENQKFVTKEATARYAETTAIDVTGFETMEQYNEYAATCDALIAYIKEGRKLGSELYTLVTEDYNGRCITAEPEGFDLYGFKAQYITPYTNRLDKVEPYQDYVFEDNDAYLAVPVELATAWTEEIQAQADEMTFGNNTLAIFGNDYMSYADATKSTLKGWNMEKNDTVTFGNYLANEFVAEVFSPKGEYTHYQEILGLEAGYYRVTVDGYFRPGDNLDEMTIEEFAKIKRAYMFGESSEQKAVMPLKNVLEGAQTEALGGSEKTYTLKDEETGEDVTVYTPNDVAAAYAYFQGALVEEPEETELEDEDLNVSVYRNTITLEVGEDGVLVIGISNVGNGYVTNDWACFSNWTLSYMGTVEPTGIASVESKTQNAPAVIYTIDGRQASRLQRGLNIVRNADGKVQKIMVK